MPAPGGARYAREDLNLLSYNVHGFNIRETRSGLQDLKRYHASVAFIQETNFLAHRAPSLRDRNFPLGFFSNNPQCRTLGVGILFSRWIHFTEQDMLRCPQGRYIFTKDNTIFFPQPLPPWRGSGRHPDRGWGPQPPSAPQKYLHRSHPDAPQQTREDTSVPTPPPALGLLESTEPKGEGLRVFTPRPMPPTSSCPTAT
ncbi:Hypothetical predicted protein [Pelobates cultripes]|uniref:Endonuclease/exonuclease/phosphatase domain-containing protein n=1 Tax=Pelobates cultripes TaxID=61616 RepID=A0AAD1RY33_PELCU|nr:Hypothetical predicted protein [Pelobates cultripes]